MATIETVESYISTYNITRTCTITVKRSKSKPVKITFYKWVFDDGISCDSDVNFDEESKKIYDSLDEDTQSEIDDYIAEISVS